MISAVAYISLKIVSMYYIISFELYTNTPGGFGGVYKAHFMKSMHHMPEIVAVKTLKGQCVKAFDHFDNFSTTTV